MDTWRAAVVAVALIAVVGVIMASAIWHDGVDKSLVLWSGISGLTGVVIGAIPSYFFRQQAQAATVQQIAQSKNESILRLHADAQTVANAKADGYAP